MKYIRQFIEDKMRNSDELTPTKMIEAKWARVKV